MTQTLFEPGWQRGIETMAQELLMGGKYMQSVSLLKDYVEKNRYCAEGYYWLGITYLFLQKTTCAKEIFNRGITLNPQDQDILFGLGVSSIALNEMKEGENIFDIFFNKYEIQSIEILGRAAMILDARMFMPAYIFLNMGFEYLKNKNYQNESEIVELEKEIIDLMELMWADYLNFSTDINRALFSRRIEIDNIDTLNLKKREYYLHQLICESLWCDALFFFGYVDENSCEKITFEIMLDITYLIFHHIMREYKETVDEGGVTSDKIFTSAHEKLKKYCKIAVSKLEICARRFNISVPTSIPHDPDGYYRIKWIRGRVMIPYTFGKSPLEKYSYLFRKIIKLNPYSPNRDEKLH